MHGWAEENHTILERKDGGHWINKSSGSDLKLNRDKRNLYDSVLVIQKGKVN
jgi:hypothetical protein